MKKSMSFALLAVSFGLVSCSSIRSISFDQLRPSEVSFPEEVSSVAVVNNMRPVPEAREGIVTLGELQGNGVFAAESLAEALADARYFDRVMICDSALCPPESGEAHRYLPQATVKRLAEDLGVDMVLALEHTSVETEKREYYYPGIPVPWSVVAARVRPELCVYMPGREKPVMTVSATDSLEWEVGTDLSDKEILKDAASFSASLLVRKLIPYWQPADRVYFDGGCVEMRDAGVYVREGDWEKAARQWESLFKKTRSGRLKAKAALNLALASEMAGDYGQAQAWMEEARKNLNPESEEETVWRFYQVRLKERIGEMPRLATQMSRFDDKF